MNLMLLAAGLGTRLRPFTEHYPKPCIPFLTAPLAFYSLELLESLKLDHLVVNTHHLPKQIENLFANMQVPPWKKLSFSDESSVLLGSGGGIHKAIHELTGHGRFLVMNADEVILPHQMGMISELINFHDFYKGIATLLCIPHPEVGKKFGGVWKKADSAEVSDFSKTAIPGLEGLHYVGVLVLSDRIRDYFKDSLIEENILYDTLKKAMGQGEKVYTYVSSAEWFETGNPEDFLKATEICLLAIENKNSALYWTEYLRQVIRLHGGSQFVIEEQNSDLKNLLSRKLPDLIR